MNIFFKAKTKLSISFRFILLFELLIFFSLSILGWQMIAISKSALQKNIDQQFDSLVENLTKETDLYLSNLNLQFAFILTLKNLSSLAKKSAYLTRNIENLNDFSSLALVDTKLNKILFQIGDPYFLNLNNQLFGDAISCDRVMLDEVTVENNTPYIDVIYPVGKNLALLTKVKLTRLITKIGLQLGNTGKVFLLTKNGKILDTKNPSTKAIEFPHELSKELENQKGRLNFVWKNNNWISAFQHTVSLNWTILLVQEEREALAAVRKMRWNAFIWLLFCIVGTAAATFWLARNLSLPIMKLSRYAQTLGKGELDVNVDVPTDTYELSVLTASLNKMAKDLKKAQQLLVEKEKNKQQLEIAHNIQNSFLVKTYPHVQGLQMHAFYQSAENAGGDFYDFFWLNEHRLAVIIGDVSGKGVTASLLMMAVRAVLRSIITPSSLTGEILKRANSILYKDIKRGLFVSMFMGIIDIAHKRLNFSSAGHNPLLLIRNNEAVWFRKTGLAIGLDSGKTFNQEVVDEFFDLKNNDIFLAYTDGVVETRNELGEDFGEKRLEKIAFHYPYSCQNLIVAINEELKQFAKNSGQLDDITMVSFKIEP